MVIHRKAHLDAFLTIQASGQPFCFVFSLVLEACGTLIVAALVY